MRYGEKFSTNEATQRGRVPSVPHKEEPIPLPEAISETLIHISGIRAGYREKISPP
jgi:hypothetical protein